MRELADAENVPSIAIPRIGVGYGGLSWKKVRVIVERVFGGWSGKLIVYEGFVPSAAGPEAEPITTINGEADSPRNIAGQNL